MDQPTTMPIARPAYAPPPPPPVHPQAMMAPVNGVPYPPQPQAPQPTDRMAVFSAVCGLTALIPIVSQVIGLLLGIISLRRIRRARRQGVLLPGTGWAVTGLVSSGFTLLGWLAFFALMAVLATTFANSTDSLNSLLTTPTP